MSEKKGNVFYVELDTHRHARMQLLFPVKGSHFPDADEEVDSDGAFNDYFAEHGMYAMSPLEKMTGEPECLALDAFVHNESAWTERCDPFDDLDYSNDPLAVMIRAEEEAEHDMYGESLWDEHIHSVLNVDRDLLSIPISFTSAPRTSMFDHSLRECEIHKNHRRPRRGNWKSREAKKSKYRETIRGASVDIEFSMHYSSSYSTLIATPRVLR